jgi:ribosomal-protein-alanine N-acetyltransferase
MLRPGTKADVEAMYRLDCLCFEEPFRFDLWTLRRFATQRDALVVVDETEGALRGFVIAEVSRRREVACGYVATIDVHPEHRRAGLARRLMAEVERLAVTKDQPACLCRE